MHATASHMHSALTCVQVLNACCLFLWVGMLYMCKLTSATRVLNAVRHLYVGTTYVHCSVVCLVHTLVSARQCCMSLGTGMLHVCSVLHVFLSACLFPQVPFPVPGAPPCCICLCRGSRNLQTRPLPIPAVRPGTVGWGQSPHGKGGTQGDAHGSGPWSGGLWPGHVATGKVGRPGTHHFRQRQVG